MNSNISTYPIVPRTLKLTAHGYIKMTSTSNITNKMAVRKYLMENGSRAFPTLSIPLSKLISLSAVFLLGPNKCVEIIVVTTKPAATQNWIKMAA